MKITLSEDACFVMCSKGLLYNVTGELNTLLSGDKSRMKTDFKKYGAEKYNN